MRRKGWLGWSCEGVFCLTGMAVGSTVAYPALAYVSVACGCGIGTILSVQHCWFPSCANSPICVKPPIPVTLHMLSALQQPSTCLLRNRQQQLSVSINNARAYYMLQRISAPHASKTAQLGLNTAAGDISWGCQANVPVNTTKRHVKDTASHKAQEGELKLQMVHVQEHHSC